MSTELDNAMATSSVTEPRISRVVAALELDERGRRAARWGRRLATDLGVEFAVIGSKQNATVERAPADDRRFVDATAGQLSAWLDDDGITADSVSVAETSLEDAIMSETGLGDVLVLGAHHHEGWTAWALGSRPHELAHHLRCPLILVPPDGVEIEDDAPVLVGLDGSDLNRRVVEWAKGFAAAIGRPIQYCCWP